MDVRIILIGLTLLLTAVPAAAQRDTTPPPIPAGLTVGAPAVQPAAVVFRVTWEAALDPPANVPVPIYRWSARFNDGTGPVQGSVAGTVLMLSMPYHASGATSGFVCIIAEDAAGNISPGAACASLAIPAKPTPAAKPTPPAQPTTTHTIEYREPTTNADGTPLKDLASIRVYWRLDGGPESVVTYPASSPAGGLVRQQRLTVPATSGTLSVTVTAVDASGNESVRTAPATKIIRPTSND